jgi:methyl-accepting chemotaxis protein
MLRRIFGIGNRKKHSNRNGHKTDGTVVLKEDSRDMYSDVSAVPLRPVSVAVEKKKEPAEIFNDVLNKLTEKLEGINENLGRQVTQNQQLVRQMDVLPEMLSSVPVIIQEHRKAFSRIIEELENKAQRDEEAAEALTGIHEKVSSTAEVHVQMAEKFSSFSDSLTKLDQDTLSQTDCLRQLSGTFSESERYFKYTLEKQQKHFYWILGISMGVCFFAISGLVIGIAFLM